MTSTNQVTTYTDCTYYSTRVTNALMEVKSKSEKFSLPTRASEIINPDQMKFHRVTDYMSSWSPSKMKSYTVWIISSIKMVRGAEGWIKIAKKMEANVVGSFKLTNFLKKFFKEKFQKQLFGCVL